jgi:hypothetical protein
MKAPDRTSCLKPPVHPPSTQPLNFSPNFRIFNKTINWTRGITFPKGIMYPSYLAILSGITTVARGHGIMIEPRPYNLETAPLQQVAPLDEKLPFPCQGRFEHVEKRTTLTAGTSQTVKFWISAVHGGGSCQFSVTYDYPPHADPKKWKTIYTIIGDCPAKAKGNLPTVGMDKDGRENGPQCGNSSGEECVRQYDIPIPPGLANSENATFAWSWWNKIGNREYYQSCAPVSIVGGADDKEFMDSLPPVFQANIPGRCTTGESGTVLNIPNPGKFGIVNVEPDALAKGNGNCPAAGPPSFVRSPQGTGTATASLVATSASSFLTVAPSKSSPPPGTSEEPTHGSSTLPMTPIATSEVTTPTGTGQPLWAAGMTRCPAADGTIYCYEDNTFGLCNMGWADPMPLNENQVCSHGEITYRYNSTA